MGLGDLVVGFDCFELLAIGLLVVIDYFCVGYVAVWLRVGFAC